MALMIPDNPHDNNSEGEFEVFNSLKAHLNDDFTVFHSVRWIFSTSKPQGEADFLILHKQKGILIIEVKSGYLECKERKWFQTNRKTNEVFEINNPMHQADSSKFKFIELLGNANPPIKKCLIGQAVWFPHFEWVFPMPPDYTNEILFDQKTLDNPTHAIEAAFDFHSRNNFRSSYNSSDFNRLRFLIAPNFSAVPSVRTNFNNRERLFISLTRDQARIMDFLDEQKQAVISGCAGTGKTMLALEKANRLGIKNEDTLFLCYNIALKKHLESNNPITHVYFKTIFELADDHIDYDPTMHLNEVTDNLADKLLSRNCKWPYKNVIIDEAQDFNSFFLETLKDITPGCFYAFYDKNQIIHQDDIMEWANNAECKLTLKINCRNTKEIARTSARNIGLDSETFNVTRISGDSVKAIEYQNPTESLKYLNKLVMDLLTSGSAKPEEIVVLTMKNLSSGLLGNKSSLCNKPLSQFLEKGSICYNSIDGFKGLEAHYLFLVDVFLPDYGKIEYRNKIYIGCSRAKHNLVLFIEKPLEEDFESAITAIGNLTKIKKNRTTFYRKIAAEPITLK